MRFGALTVVAPLAFAVSSSMLAQASSDSVHLGDRVRVHIAAGRENPNVFVGNLAQSTPDSVLLDIPGQKGHVVLARASIADVAVSAGRESRLATIMRTIPLTLPVIVATSLVATTGVPDHGPHHVALRNQRLALVGMEALLLGRIFNRTPAEKWREVAHW
jgi:hypothetical protein